MNLNVLFVGLTSPFCRPALFIQSITTLHECTAFMIKPDSKYYHDMYISQILSIYIPETLLTAMHSCNLFCFMNPYGEVKG